ncbi:hypothetical protein KP509_19G005700 [Ceratopteris richardii]|uniref:NAD(P)-binding domain-containing protein n=1 Tax=Ceratopteris richardii TaxID=49495 RepID=A0A8T2SHJ1_CERRI|nr:hypothetical protein KP509_19G005700 [Ceratopteris richardii]
MLYTRHLSLELRCCAFSTHPTQRPRALRASSAEDGRGKVFVAGAAGNTGKRIVKELLASGYKVRAGVRDLAAGSNILPADGNMEIVQADVTEGAEKLAAVIGNVESVVCATGFRRSLDFFAPWKVDNFGTVNLVDACKRNNIRKFVLISSILVNGAAMGQVLNPAYVFLNALGLTLIAKLQAENYVRKSGINYTIIRPGGLTNNPPSGNIVMTQEDTLYEGSISRDAVASVAVKALQCPEASYKVVEIVSRFDAPRKSIQELFAAIK